MNETATAPVWPTSDLEPVSNCLFCGSDARVHIYDDLNDITFFNAGGDFRMARCEECHAGYLDPRPTPESIGRAYAQYYTHSGGHDLGARGGIVRRLRRALADDYRRQRYGAKTGMPIPGGAALIRALAGQREVLDSYYRHLPKTKGRLFDFGCGNGAFLRVARDDLGWDAEGNDFDPTAVAAVRKAGFEAYEGGEEVLAGLEGRYDAVTLSHVIEHVFDPAALMRAVMAVLKPGGMVFVETPNMDALGREVYGRHWRGLEAPRHLGIPSWTSMERLLADAGFERLSRHPRRATQAPMFKRSAALAAGQSSEAPEAMSHPGPTEAQVAALAADLSRSEYVTMTAYRPA